MICSGSDKYQSRKTITNIIVNLTFKVIYRYEMADLWHFQRLPFLFWIQDLLLSPFPQHFLVFFFSRSLLTFLWDRLFIMMHEITKFLDDSVQGRVFRKHLLVVSLALMVISHFDLAGHRMVYFFPSFISWGQFKDFLLFLQELDVSFLFDLVPVIFSFFVCRPLLILSTFYISWLEKCRIIVCLWYSFDLWANSCGRVLNVNKEIHLFLFSGFY